MPKIFVSIASYRDPELLPTLRDLINNCQEPENLHICVGWQHSEEDTWDTLTEFINDNRFEFINYDHISENEAVISCDISNTPLENDSVDICVLSYAMWGSNCNDYIKETNRILESSGKLYIIEPTRRWSNKDDNQNIIEGQQGEKLRELLQESGFIIIRESIEKFSLFECVKL